MAPANTIRVIRPDLKAEARRIFSDLYRYPGIPFRSIGRNCLRAAYRRAAEAQARREKLLGGWISVTTEGRQILIEAGSKGSVEKAIETCLKGYPPEGYGTGFNPPYQRSDGTWAASGSRLASSD